MCASIALSSCSGGLKNPAATVGFATITGTSPIAGDGYTPSIISIQVLDTAGNPFSGYVPTFDATDTGGRNSYGACTVANSQGYSTCTLTSLKAETKTLRITSPITFSGGSVTFLPGAPSDLAITTQPSSTGIAGADLTQAPVISILDSDGNVVSDATNTVTLTAYTNSSCTTPATGTLSAASNPLDAVSGVATFSSVNFSKTGTIYLKATATGLSSVCTSAITISPAAASSLSFQTNPSSTGTAGVALSQQPVVALYDAFGNLVNSGATSSSAVTLSAFTNSICTAAYSGTFSATTNPLNASAGIASFNGVKGTKSGSMYIKASSGALTSACSSLVTISANVPDAVASSFSTTSTVAANLVDYASVVIFIRDAYSNGIQGITPTFSATDTGGTNVYGSCTSSASTGASTCTFSSATPEAKTVQMLTPVAKTGPVINFVAAPSSANSTFALSSGPIVANGTSTATITITLLDGSSAPVTGLIPRVTASGTGNTISTCTATNGSGVSTCTWKSTKAEAKTLDLTTPVALGPLGITFIPGAASRVGFKIQPVTTANPGIAFGTQPTAQIQDVSGNAITSGAPSTLDVQISAFTNNTCTTPAPGVFTVDTNPVTAVAGDAPFTGISYTKSGAIYLKVTATGLTSGCSNAVTVISNTAATLSFTTQPSTTGTAGTALSQQPVVTSSDAYGNTPTSGSASVKPVTLTAYTDPACTTTAATGTLSATTNPLTSAGGVATFAGVNYTKAESIYLKATAPAMTSACSNAIAISSGAASALTSTISGTSPVVANGTASSTISILLADAYSNVITGVRPTFTASNPASGNTYGTCSLTNSSGNSTCTLKSTVAGSKVVHLTSPSVNGNTVIFTSSFASALKYFTQPSSTAIPNELFVQAPELKVVDDYGNIVETEIPEITLTPTRDENCDTRSKGKLSLTQNPRLELSYDREETLHLRANAPGLKPACSTPVHVSRWTPISDENAPSARFGHSAVWTGSKMIIFGGQTLDGYSLADGAIYDGILDRWTPLNSDGAPSPRHGHSAVWIDGKMIVFGGQNGVGSLEDAGIYDPVTDSWERAFTILPIWREALTAKIDPLLDLKLPIHDRFQSSAVWAGPQVILWGGCAESSSCTTPLGSGFRYTPP